MRRTDANVRKNAINCPKKIHSGWAFQNANTCAKIFYPSLIRWLRGSVCVKKQLTHRWWILNFIYNFRTVGIWVELVVKVSCSSSMIFSPYSFKFWHIMGGEKKRRNIDGINQTTTAKQMVTNCLLLLCIDWCFTWVFDYQFKLNNQQKVSIPNINQTKTKREWE